MNVTLESVTPDALTLLLRTKNTRLAHDDDPATWDDAKRAEHLAYMLDTIRSSWEFVDYTFRIEGVTRAFTHQLVRSRHGSYAQETMRSVDVRGHEVVEPEAIRDKWEWHEVWQGALSEMRYAYGRMIDRGASPQDARGLLPTNITTSIFAKFNLRTLSEMAKTRLCTRTQGEYQDVFRAMRERVVEVHPWAADFLEVHCVATGTCAFPRYGKAECPVYLPEMDNTPVREAAKRIFWATRYEAAPRAKGGRTM
jgi:flavin-dependent thymidylate synthase